MKRLALCIDLSFCLIVMPALALMFPVERWLHYFRGFMITAGVWLYFLYVLNRTVTVPCMTGTRRSMWSILILLLSVALTYALSRVELYSPPPNPLDAGIVRLFPSVKQYQQMLWCLFVIVEAFSIAVGLLVKAEKRRERLRAVEAERDHAEIALYKARVKPHFLFNTLNSLYGLFLTGSPRALPALEAFISLMRYMQQAFRADLIPLADEADYIRQYVSLQSLRLPPHTRVSLDIDISCPTTMIPPMLLVTFVENCFKHGVSSEQPSLISISLTEQDGELRLLTSNSIFPPAAPCSGTGIENCRRRLALHYPGSHSLSIKAQDATFTVNLSIYEETHLRGHRR